MQIKEILEHQKKFFGTNITKDVSFRKKQLKKIKDIILQNEELLYKAIYKDFNKSSFDT